VGLDANQIRTCVCIAFFRTVWLLQFSSRASCFAFALLDGRISVPRHVHISMSVIASFLCPFKFGALSFLSLSPVWWQKTAPQSSCSLFSFCLPSHFWAAGPAVPRPTRLPDAAPSALACLLTVRCAASDSVERAGGGGKAAKPRLLRSLGGWSRGAAAASLPPSSFCFGRSSSSSGTITLSGSSSSSSPSSTI
jgi:hypothetical protein